MKKNIKNIKARKGVIASKSNKNKNKKQVSKKPNKNNEKNKKMLVLNKNISKNTNKLSVKPKLTEKARLQEEEKNKNLEIVKENAKSQLKQQHVKEYISKNVGSVGNTILDFLVEKPDVDENIAEVLKIKLNETRRVLNLLNSYGLLKYNTNKDTNGWLTFVWYMDYNSIDQFLEKVEESNNSKTIYLPEDCNDFFICNNCSKTHTMIVSFETAFDSQFKCVCGNKLNMIEREKAEDLYKNLYK